MIKLLESFTIAPHILRASHHLSYDWAILKESSTEMAVPRKVGIPNGISGMKGYKYLVIICTIIATITTYNKSYRTFRIKYSNGTFLDRSI